MARYNEKKIPYAAQERLLGVLCAALSRLKTKAAIRRFLKDLLNRQERTMLVRRMLIAEMLLRGSTYLQIIQHLHCGTPTIARVDRWLHFGRGGYLRAFGIKRRGSS